MIYQIQRNDEIFKSDLFLKDKVVFNLMISIVESTESYPDIRCFSDGKDCIIVNTDKKHPIIIWTSNNFNAVTELYDFIKQEFVDNEILSIISKQELMRDFERIKAVKLFNYTENVYSCSDINDIKYTGYMDSAKESDIAQISNLLELFLYETGLSKTQVVSKEQCDEDAKKYVGSSSDIVWRNSENKLVAIGSIKYSKYTGQVVVIMTEPTERGKSYAKMVVHYLTSEIMKKGKTPIILADDAYASSNKCYQAVGYKLKGKFVLYTLFKDGEH